MCVSPVDSYSYENFQGYGFTRGTLIGRQAVYGSAFESRLSRSSFAHGWGGRSPGFRPPSPSVSPFDPPPTHGALEANGASGTRGNGRVVDRTRRSNRPPDPGSRSRPGAEKKGPRLVRGPLVQGSCRRGQWKIAGSPS